MLSTGIIELHPNHDILRAASQDILPVATLASSPSIHAESSCFGSVGTFGTLGSAGGCFGSIGTAGTLGSSSCVSTASCAGSSASAACGPQPQHPDI